MSHKLTPKQVKAIYLLARGQTSMEVANHLKMRRETLSRWKKDPVFSAEFEKVMGEVRDGLKDRLTHLADLSITTVRAEFNAIHSNPKVVLTALGVLKLLGIEQVVSPKERENDAVSSENKKWNRLKNVGAICGSLIHRRKPPVEPSA